MKMINDICFSTTIFGPENPELNLLAMLDVIKKSGYSWIEISRHQHNIAEREQLIRDTGLKVWSIHGVLGMTAASLDETQRKEAVDDEKRRMNDTACFAPCPYVIHYVNRYNDPAYGVAYQKSVKELLEHAHQLNITLAVETAPFKPEENERYPFSQEIADFVRSFGPDLKMTIDINHSNLHENLPDVCRNCKDLIANVHISNNHGIREEHLSPECGIIDIRQAFKDLRENGYNGPLNLELHLAETPAVKKLTDIYNYSRQLLVTKPSPVG